MTDPEIKIMKGFFSALTEKRRQQKSSYQYFSVLLLSAFCSKTEFILNKVIEFFNERKRRMGTIETK